MRQLHHVLLALATATGLQSTTAAGQEIEIKGLRLGMTRAEVVEKAGPLPLENFTIAGAPSKHPRVSPAFHDDKLDSLNFFFDANHSDDVRGALEEKFPALDCENSTVTNAMGVSFTLVSCRLRDQLGTLHLSRFVSDVNTSVLSLTSDRMVKELSDKRKEKQKDL